MKRLKSVFVYVGAALAALSSVLVLALPAAAADSSSLSITPKKNYEINAGHSVNDTLIIRNLDDNNPLSLSLRVIDFSYTDQSGTPKLLIAANAPQTTWSLKPYMTLPKTVSIAAGGTKTVALSVSIPKNLGAGSYYSAILYSAGSPAEVENGNVGLSASGATLVFVQVPGQVKENLTLKQFGAYLSQSQTATPDFTPYITGVEPWTLAYTLKNSGNVTESPAGTISFKYMFGKPTTIQNVNPQGSLALIGQARTFVACIKLQTNNVQFQGSTSEQSGCAKPGLWPGLYTASLDVFYGQNGNLTQELTGTTSFWYLPWWFVLGFVVIVLLIAFFVWRIVRRIRKFLYGPRVPRRSSHLKR